MTQLVAVRVAGGGRAQIQQWKRQLLDEGAAVFERKGKTSVPSSEPDALHCKIGQLTIERDFLQEKLALWLDPSERR